MSLKSTGTVAEFARSLMVKSAQQGGARVEGLFNGITVVAEPRKSVDDMVASYQIKRKNRDRSQSNAPRRMK